MDPSGVTVLGECAHIYAAKRNGPRGRHNFPDSVLSKPENGIYLCSEHHSMIDKKVNLSLYTPQTLQLFKETHEQLISKEIGQLHYPLNWIKSITVNNSPVLRAGLKYEFTKTS